MLTDGHEYSTTYLYGNDGVSPNDNGSDGEFLVGSSLNGIGHSDVHEYIVAPESSGDDTRSVEMDRDFLVQVLTLVWSGRNGTGTGE